MTRLIRTLQTSSGRVPVATALGPDPPTDGEPVSTAPFPRGEERGAALETATRPSPAGKRAGTLRKARMADAPAIEELVALFADRDEMLHRSVSEIRANIRDYCVVEEAGRVVGCAALHIDTEELGEIKALAVAEECQGRGYGRDLVLACVEEGYSLGLATVFALTYKPAFFEKLGFHVVDKATLPHKVWTECIRCPKFPDCGEIAVVRDLR